MYDLTMRRALLAVGLGAAVLLPAGPAPAKEGVRAKLDRPVNMQAAPGTRIRVAWTLRTDGRPFGASGIFVVLTSATGARRTRALANQDRPGHFVARIRVPRGGIRRVRIGLEGWRTAGGHTTRADAYFPVDAAR